MSKQYSYKTDSESGTIEAASLDRAYNRKRSFITDAMISDGATLWVEDEEGNRITMSQDGEQKRNFPMPMIDVLFTRGESPEGLTLIDDGQFLFPVATSQFNIWKLQNGKLTSANYEKFCDEVKAIGVKQVGAVGSAEMIALCQELIEAGSKTVRPE